MIVEAIEKVQELQRQPLLDTKLGTYIYSDAKHEYMPLLPIFIRSVSNVESFAAYVLEEARRRGNKDGEKITVSFNEHGGDCWLADGDLPDAIKYSRELSPQWNFLVSNLGRKHKHADFIRLLQTLQPLFMDGYAEMLKAYRRVTFNEDTSITSQPLVEDDGKSGVSINVQYTRGSGGTANAHLPAGLQLQVQYARGSSRTYGAALEIDCELLSRSSDKKEIVFQLAWPGMEATIVDAVRDEIEDFRKLVSEKLPAALVVLNF